MNSYGDYNMPDVRNTDPNSWYLDTVIVYMCGVAWKYYTPHDARGTTVYGSRESLEHNCSCTKRCGILEIEMKVRSWVVPQNLHGENDD
jgi:hypothetical protein